MSPGSAGPLPDGFRVAVVGGGISGLACAGALKARGAHVVVFEATRRPGGRAATEITPATDVMEVRRLMLERHARYLPVLDGRTLAGVISFYDVARAVLEEQSFENRMLKAYIRDWPEPEEARSQ